MPDEATFSSLARSRARIWPSVRIKYSCAALRAPGARCQWTVRQSGNRKAAFWQAPVMIAAVMGTACPRRDEQANNLLAAVIARWAQTLVSGMRKCCSLIPALTALLQR